MKPRHPSLYRLADDGRTVLLLFGRCEACASLTFPANAYGCAACGAPRLETIERPGEGKLQAVATLTAQVLPDLPVPQVVGDVEIARGIVEEVLIEGEEAGLSPGHAMVAIAHPLGDGTFECRFARAGA